ncbi:beta-N-acetylhexosaminidase [Mucilaginibacter pedocola]|uniref:N-acetyl-beta-hexosaminidase n=1 Tax=Mucilaginibacter pedocola TaxID=1792845 RepID=A0A1S9PFQ3_9SPHI|nr:beta-N-acetylhexosaminidase [Mucilaginibacter pedocola]OOQ59785.1 N-acetyl-beta-hexosaminidase [Mucilaginibacter pedocola]
MKNYFKTQVLLLLLLVSVTAKAWASQVPPADSVAVKGFHLDMRIQVMQLPALKKFAAKLAGKGINTIVMEWEGSYPFKNEPLIANRYAYTPAQVAEFISYCKQLKIQVIPLQQSFGHVEYILRNYKYAAQREDQKDFSQVCPSEPELNKKLFTTLFAELIATHNSPYLHIGGDETYLLGHCEKCKKRAAEIGLSRLYFDHIKMLCDIVVSMGKRPIVWADIALKYPDYINLLPKQTIFIDWNYGWDVNHFGDHAKLLKSGYEIWGSPSIRSYPDNFFLTDWQKHFKNIHDFIPLSRSLNYKGIVMTSWSTSGVYSSLFESEGDLIDLYAIRHVYPLSGFNILVDYYLQTLGTNKVKPVDDFIADYCHDTFGFDKSKAEQFKKTLFAAPYSVQRGKVVSNTPLTVSNLLDTAENTLKVFKSLAPAKGAQEYRHFLLMARIRVYYLTFMEIEAEVNAPTFTLDKAPAYAAKVKKLMADEHALSAEFNALNGGFIHPAAIAEENLLRSQKVHVMYDRLAKIK